MFKNIFNFFFGCLKDFIKELIPEKPKIRLKNDFTYEASEAVVDSNLSMAMKFRVLNNLSKHLRNNKYVDFNGFMRIKENIRKYEELEQRGLEC